jgi:hypothetical protein
MTGQSLNSLDIYQPLLSQNILGQRPIQFSDLTQFGIGPNFRSPTTGGVADDYQDAYSEQASLEIERTFAGFALSAAYNFSRTLHLPRTRDRNLFLAGTQPNGQPIFGRIDPSMPFTTL